MAFSKPKQIKLTQEQMAEVEQAIKRSNMPDNTKELILSILAFVLWLQDKLRWSKITIAKLRKLFSLSQPSEKLPASQTNNEDDEPPPDDGGSGGHDNKSSDKSAKDPDITTTNPKKPENRNPDENHGRLSADAYTGCQQTTHELPSTLKPGNLCPHCADGVKPGKLYRYEPKVLVLLTAAPLLTGTQHHSERSRCGLCGTVFTADLPTALEQTTGHRMFDETCAPNVAYGRYMLGIPFTRQQTLQAEHGIPVPDATLWDLMVKLKACAWPVYQALLFQAAQSGKFFYDDTPNRITQTLGVQLHTQCDRKGIYTTAMIAELPDDKVAYLFFTANQTGGENMTQVIGQRQTSAPIMTMTDASNNNRIKAKICEDKEQDVDIPQIQITDELVVPWIICFCLAHGRRKFFEIMKFFDKKCNFVLKVICTIYKNEAYCKQNNLTPTECLAYHQKHSQASMDSLRLWLKNQLQFRQEEPNSPFGEAVTYMLKNWDALTRFLTVVGAAIDNNLSERAIKIVIRHRKNSLHYRTINGAITSDCLLSLMQTARVNHVPIIDYLGKLQLYQQEVKQQPDAWFPWNYTQTLSQLTQEQAA